ncbi:MAG: hypothetical protein V3V33_11445 [Candidatus Lokiarchaeia archaeon]
MNRNLKIIIGIIAITIGIGQVIFIGLNNRNKVLWEYGGGYQEHNGATILNIPPNPIVGNKFAIKVSADFYNVYYMHHFNYGSINFTHQKSGRIFVFEYNLIYSVGVNVDAKENQWSLPSGGYNVTWENRNCAYKYKLIKAGIGYPHNGLLLIGSVIISITFILLGILTISLALEIIGKHRKNKII